MAWLDGWRKRVPVAIDNGTPTSTLDASIPIPDDWDDFWGSVDTDGDEIRLTAADGVTVLTYQIGASPAWSKANRTGVLEVDNMGADNAAASVIVAWLYWDNAGAASAAGSFTAASARNGYIHNGEPRGFVVPARPIEPGSTRPVSRLQKAVGEAIYVWFELRGMLERRVTPYGDSRLWEEPFQIVAAATAAGAPAAIVTVNKTRLVETLEGGRRQLFVGIKVSGGASGTSYTLEPVIDTVAPELRIDTGVLYFDEYRTIEPRAILTVYDASEV
jgi:hypothetical protein